MAQRAKELFTYEADYLPLVASASQVDSSINISSEADFIISRTMVYRASNTAGAYVDPAQTPATVMWSNPTTGRNYSNANVPLANLYGFGQRPFILPVMLLIVGKSVFNVSCTNLSAGDLYLRLSHSGYKEYYRDTI